MKYFFALLMMLAAIGTAIADSRDTTITTVPFDFVIGNKTLPAGKYVITRISDDPSAGLRIQSSDGKTTQFFRPTTWDSGADQDAKLEFLHQGNMYFLTGIVSGPDIYTLTPKHHPQRTAEPSETVTVNP